MKSTTKQVKPEKSTAATKKPAPDEKKTATTRAAKAGEAIKAKAAKTDAAKDKVEAPKTEVAPKTEAAKDKTEATKADTAKAGLADAGEAPTVTINASATTPPQSQPKSGKRKSGGLTLFLWLVGVAAAIGAGAATWPFWSSYVVPGTAASKSVQAQLSVAERLGNLEKNIEKDIANNATNGNTIQDLLDEKNRVKERLDKLMVKINSLDAALKSVRQMVEATTPPSSQAANANKSLQKLSDRFAKIEKSSETLGNLLQRMDMLEKNIPAAQDQPTAIDKGLSDAIDEISQRVGALEQAGLGKDPYGGSALMLAISQLREILHSSDPFPSQLAALMELAGDDSEIAGSLNKIEPYASSGIPNLDQLRSRFADVSLSLSEIGPVTPGNGWLDSVKKRLSSLISLRRINGKMDAVISKTNNLLNDGDLSGAINVLADYSDASPKVAAWVGAARKRLAAESAIAALHVFALSLIAPKKEQTR